MATVKDVVCGMDIDSESAAATSDYEGTTYYFCAVGCKEQFDANPGKFLGTEAATETPAAREPAAAEPAAAGPEPKKWWQFWRS